MWLWLDLIIRGQTIGEAQADNKSARLKRMLRRICSLHWCPFISALILRSRRVLLVEQSVYSVYFQELSLKRMGYTQFQHLQNHKHSIWANHLDLISNGQFREVDLLNRHFIVLIRHEVALLKRTEPTSINYFSSAKLSFTIVNLNIAYRYWPWISYRLEIFPHFSTTSSFYTCILSCSLILSTSMLLYRV